ncbi:hypothetical protein D3Z52_23165 [Clostridiaceae bacterium]|nr:hypothetical protein [Clostridiaceae bacterium]
MNATITVGNTGLYLDGQFVSNAIPEVRGLYTKTSEEAPSTIEISVSVGNLPPKTLFVPVEGLNFATLHKDFPAMSCVGSKRRELFDAWLHNLYVQSPEDYYHGTSSLKIGSFVTENGILQLPYGTLGAIEGGETLGLEKHYVIIDSKLATISVLRDVYVAATLWLPLLLSLPNAALMVLGFTLLSMVRSAVLNAGIHLQAVLFVTGLQGIGKTTLISRFVSFITKGISPNKPALFFDLGSSLAGLRIAMTTYRDLPIVADNACKSASKAVQRKREEVLAQIIREAANAAPIMKASPGGNQVELENVASVLFTAEDTPKNESDLTRCILVKISEQPDLPEELTPDMVSAIR